MASKSVTKPMKELLTLSERKGCHVKRPGDGTALITTKDGIEFRMSPTSLGQIMVVRLTEMDTSEGDHQDRNGRPANIRVIGRDMGGRRHQNALSDLASIGLDLRDHPKKEAVRKNEPDEPPTGSVSPKVTPMTQAVDEILADQATVEELLISTILSRAREARAPLFDINSQTYMHWNGDIIEILKLGWDDIDEANAAEKARLERFLVDGYLSRGGRLVRVHKYPDGNAVWQVQVPSDLIPVITAERALDEATQDDKTEKPDISEEAQEQSTQPARDLPEGLYGCDLCPFVAESVHALSLHKSKMKGEHPQEVWPCPRCRSVRTSFNYLKQHLKVDHDAVICNFCADGGEIAVFSSDEVLGRHRDALHEGRSRRSPATAAAKKKRAEREAAKAAREAAKVSQKPAEPVQAPLPPDSASEPAEAVSEPPQVSPEPAPQAAGTALEHPQTAEAAFPALNGTILGKPADAVRQAAMDMLTQLPQILADNEKMRGQLDRLRDTAAEVERLTGELEMERVARAEAEHKAADAERKLIEITTQLEAIQKLIGR